MPVQIIIGDTSNDPRVISLDEYMDGRANFTLHYYYTSEENPFGGQVIDAPWQQLKDAVDAYMAETGVGQDEVALRFVHCFDQDVTPVQLYYRLQICQMVPSPEPPPPGAAQVYDLVTTNCRWYEIKQGIFQPTPDEELANLQYLSNFYYKSEPQSAVIIPLTDGPTQFVKNLVLPWGQEILAMWEQNGRPDGATIHFAACSYYRTDPEYSAVEWPHGIDVYLSEGDHTYLNNEDYVLVFHNKGADYSTLCPPRCGVYVQPALTPPA